jgi:hypothetical protein
VAISVGVTLIALQMLFVKEPPKQAAGEAAAPDEDGAADDAPVA